MTTDAISLCDQLKCAILWNDVVKIRNIIEEGKKTDAAIDEEYNPLFDALDDAHIAALQCLIDLMPEQINRSNLSDGYTPLMMAVQNNEVNVVKLLISAGASADVDKATDSLGCTVLMHAKTPEMVSLLLDTRSGANPTINARDTDGYTMLMKTDDPDIFKILIEHGADVTREAPHHITTLMTTNSFAIAEMCVEHGMDVNQYSDYGYPTISYPRNPDIVKLLLNYGANVNAQDSDHGYTLLMQAADPLGTSYYAGDIENKDYYGSAANCYRVANMALHAGANIAIHDNSGMSALTLAHKCKNSAIEDLIITYMPAPDPHDTEAVNDGKIAKLESKTEILTQRLTDMDQKLTSLEALLNEYIDKVTNYPAP